MPATGLDTFDRTLQLSNEWLGDIMEELRTDDRHLAYSALRTVLHAVRDRLPVDASAHLASQLPMLIRGIYFEGWSPSRVPSNEGEEDFLRRAREGIDDRDPREVLESVLRVLDRRVTQGEIDQVYQSMPADVRRFWKRAA